MIGERLADLRKDANMSQEELGKKLGITFYTVSSYEREKSTPDDAMKIKIAKLFNISLDYLLGLIDDERPIGGGHGIPIPDDLPPVAIKEIRDHLSYIKAKYKK